MDIIYKSTPKKDRTMDQHCQAVLDMLRDGFDMRAALTDDQKRTWIEGAGFLEHDELDDDLKLSFIPLAEMMLYMHRYFPAVEDHSPMKTKRLIDECTVAVFGGYQDKTGAWISTEIDVWKIPPECSYDIFPIAVIREGFKRLDLPLSRADVIKRGKLVRPWRAFAHRYAEIILAA